MQRTVKGAWRCDDRDALLGKLNSGGVVVSNHLVLARFSVGAARCGC